MNIKKPFMNIKMRKMNSLYRIQYDPRHFPELTSDDTWFGGKIYPRCSGDPMCPCSLYMQNDYNF
jgi:hypothetical protein